ncbi:long-chain-fatty-acid--CoA ligase 1 [Eurytemora carolleeae]|uniref:long-chain-fatty-acid--CoA ligase 1 n=1 Tax=Eurytemora carolleeae TaxID=1294199 RepID=UPI000C773CB8|nr:long-chain-fatty-acid--CoA ligase 1 [Eurytemora carolleeae]|eukprot:XP_023346235.1 long-chain-fatty-acid--CoA ligase 1-like [Eurytemora affinis]
MGMYNPNMVKIPLETFTYNNQSDVIKGAQVIRSSKWNKDSQRYKFTEYLEDDCRTIYDAFRRGAAKSNGGICLGWRNTHLLPYQWLTYEEVLLRAQNFGSGLISMGLQPGLHTMVGIYSRNCPEWVICEQGLFTYSMVSVPLYDSLGVDARSFVLSECDMRVVIVYNEENAKNVLDSNPPPCLKVLITIKDIRPRVVEEADTMGIKVLRFTEVEKFGARNKVPDVPPNVDATATICFAKLAAFGETTSDRPKGVMLSHRNIMAATTASVLQLGDYAPKKTDILFSFLPLAHTLEKCCELAVFLAGGAVGFYSGDLRLVNQDMKALKPTILPAVPRFINRIYDRVVTGANRSAISRHIFNMALAFKTDEMYKGVIRNNSVWDKLVFWSVRKKLGGRIRLVIVGSAPLAGNVLTFMRAALGCLIVEGYGQTECVAPCTLTAPGDPQPDQVGPPLPCNNIKLVDVPDMEYFSAHGQGEVCVLGSNVFQGYYRDPERTCLVIDQDGWLHTGDIGEWLPNGTLKLIDRKKHIFKVAQGEYVAPEKLEEIYAKSMFVSQVFIHGDSVKSCVVGIIVPDIQSVQDWAGRRKMPNDSFTALCNSREVKNLIMKELEDLAREFQIKNYEKVKVIYLKEVSYLTTNLFRKYPT